MLKNWDWEDVWVAVLITFIVSGVTIGISIGTFAPKNVDYYYISGPNDNTVCAYAHWTWHVDERSYCSEDVNKVLDFVQKANATLHKKKEVK